MISLTPEEKEKLRAEGLISGGSDRPVRAERRSETRRARRNAEKRKAEIGRNERRRAAAEEQRLLALEARQRREATIIRRDESARVDAKINALVNRRLLRLDPYRLAR